MLDVCYEAHNYFLTLSWVSPLRLLEQKAKKWNTSDWVTFKQERSSLQRPRGPDLSTVGDCILVHGSFVLVPRWRTELKHSGLSFRRAARSVMGAPSSCCDHLPRACLKYQTLRLTFPSLEDTNSGTWQHWLHLVSFLEKLPWLFYFNIFKYSNLIILI